MPGAHRKRRSKRPNAASTSRELLFKDDEQQYAKVVKTLGNGRFHAMCDDLVERLCKLRGAMRRSEWVTVGDVVLVSIRAFQDAKADILHKYTDIEVRNLKKYGELTFMNEEVVQHHHDDDEDDDVDLIDFLDDV